MGNSWMIQHYIKHVLTAKRGGHGVHSPFVYQLVENVFNNHHHFYAFEQLNALRKELCNNETELTINDMGAGSQKLSSAKRKVKDIALHGISSKRQAELMFRLCTYLRSKTIIELGTSLGLTSLYFSYTDAHSRVFTLEGSVELVNFSKTLFKQQERANITSIAGNFDETLPTLLADINSFDLLYIDGNHTYEATLRYFKIALEKINSDSVIIFDDIYWSKEMTKAWGEIKEHSAVTVSIDCFYFGMLFFRKEQKQKEHFKLYI
jgi:predicted O-methyltransferase YrrM